MRAARGCIQLAFVFLVESTRSMTSRLSLAAALGAAVLAASPAASCEYPSWSSRIGGPIAIGFDESVGSLDELAHERDDGNLGGLSRRA